MNIEEKYYILIHKEFLGDLNRSEKTELNNWLADSEENHNIYSQVIKNLSEIKVPVPRSGFDLDAGWNELETRILQTEKEGFFSKFRYYNIAASIILILGLSLLFNPFEDKYTIVKNLLQSKKKVTLPDNSVVILDKNSQLSYNFDNSLREVTLQGKAFFDVTKSEKKFIIETFNSKVEVLGTEFNVDARKNYSSVAVRSGKVSFSDSEENNVILAVNQFSECVEGSGPTIPVEIDVDSLINWTKTELVFENQKLKSVIERLEKEFSVKYKVTDPVLSEKKLSAVFENESIEIINKSIETALNLTITKINGIYHIKK